jgi:hypothetical protein
LRNSPNIPGFELNSINDDSIIFSFDLINNGGRNNRSNRSGTGPGPGPNDIDEVD